MLLVILKSSLMLDIAGDNMDEESVVMKVIIERRIAEDHFRRTGQFSGIAGSS